MTRLFLLLVSAFALTACGGSFDKDGDDSGGQAGGAGTAGSGSGGSGSGGQCSPGETSSDRCNSCTCQDGQFVCTNVYCPDYDCTYGKLVYQAGESFPAVDGCNTCTCMADGTVACTELGCATCEDVSTAVSAAITEAKTCDPAQANPCSQVIAGNPVCGCPTYVNPENAAAVAAIEAGHDQYADLMCGPSPCDCASPAGAYCSADGQCVDIWDGSQASCMVNGAIYPSGSSGFAGPLGCNTCSCDDGQLTCTEEECPSACPPDSVNGTQCAQCGPADACEVVEYTCLKVCSDTCETGICFDGVCKDVCG